MHQINMIMEIYTKSFIQTQPDAELVQVKAAAHIENRDVN